MERRDAWVMLHGYRDDSAMGARVELVERKQQRVAGPDGGAGGGYAWAIFPVTPHGRYTVRVTYRSGTHQHASLTVDRVTHLITLEEPPG